MSVSSLAVNLSYLTKFLGRWLKINFSSFGKKTQTDLKKKILQGELSSAF